MGTRKAVTTRKRTKASSTTDPINIEHALKRDQALALRLAGATYRNIAQQIDRSAKTAHQMVEEALRETEEATAEKADSLRELELRRLDRLMLSLWQRALGGRIEKPNGTIEESPPNAQYIDRILKIMERRARLVIGLEAPIEIDTRGQMTLDEARSVHEAVSVKVDNRLAALLAARGGTNGSSDGNGSNGSRS